MGAAPAVVVGRFVVRPMPPVMMAFLVGPRPPDDGGGTNDGNSSSMTLPADVLVSPAGARPRPPPPPPPAPAATARTPSDVHPTNVPDEMPFPEAAEEEGGS